MRVGLFGGSFDPPHRGHLVVAQAARDTFAIDRVLLTPVGSQPLKPHGAAATFAQRLAMTALLCSEDSSGVLQASDLDAPRPDGEPNFTVDTLKRLRGVLAKDDALFVITGADAFLGLRRWREPERLLALAEWIVVSRPGTREGDLAQVSLNEEQRAHVHWLGGVVDPVSATDLRTRLTSGDDCSGLVTLPVLAYIREHRLYAPKEGGRESTGEPV